MSRARTDASLAGADPPVAKRLATLAGPMRGRLRLASTVNVLAGWLLLPQAALIAFCVQQVFVGHRAPRDLLPAVLGLSFTLLLRALLGWCGRRLADHAVERIRQDVRSRIARRLVRSGPHWVRTQRSGALAERMGAHVDALEGYFGGFVPARAEVVWVPLAILIATFAVDRVVGTILLVTMPLVPIFMMLVGWGAEAASRRQLQALARMGGHFADRLRGLGLIRLYGRGEDELQGIRTAAEELRTRSLKVLRIAFLSSAVLEFFASLSVAMIALYLGLSYLGMIDLRMQPLPLEAGVFCLLLAPEFYAPLRRLATHYHDRAAALAAVDEIAHVLGPLDESGIDDVPAAPMAHESLARRGGEPLLRTHGLDVQHGKTGPTVLRDIDIALHRGDHVALVGPSGCGKSTLLETLIGWLQPVQGTLEHADGLRIGYAPQRPFLFAGSIADNLRLARPDATDDEVRRAAEAAQVTAFADRLPDGLDTVIGERGFGLSGGEARRIALARVFLRDADVLLLDEPTAFLDPATEAAVLAAIQRYAQGRAVLMATHGAAATLAMARVWTIDDGRVRAGGGAP